MPFELTHVAIGQHALLRIGKPLTQQLLAGLLYPDVRYPFLIDRRLTHTMDGLLDPAGDDFAYGVQLHLKTDLLWDHHVLLHGDIDIETVPDRSLFIGLLKIIHDKICYPTIMQPKSLAHLILTSPIAPGLAATNQQWRQWTEALSEYLIEGPTEEGWRHIITAMKYVDPAILTSYYSQVEAFELHYVRSLNTAFTAIVNELGSQ